MPRVGLGSRHGRRGCDAGSPGGGVDPPGAAGCLAGRLPRVTFSASLASLDGAITLSSQARIPATDAGLLRGDGAFEVIRVYDGKPFRFEDHLRRIERSASNLRLPLDLEAVRVDAHLLLAHAGAGPDHELLRVVLTRGGRRLLLTEALPDIPERVRLGTITYSPTRVL